MNHNLVWNQITRFSFAGTNTRADDEGQTQLCTQSEKQKSLLREKYAVDKLYIVIEDVASTSTLDVGAVRGTLVAVIKKQDPMGDPARWYVDTGTTQGFLPSHKLKPAQQSPPRDRTATTDAAASRKSPPNLMSLDSPEKEIKKTSQSHLQDLLSLDINKETRVNQTYSNIPETPRTQIYQNINSEVSIFILLVFRLIALWCFLLICFVFFFSFTMRCTISLRIYRVRCPLQMAKL